MLTQSDTKYWYRCRWITALNETNVNIAQFVSIRQRNRMWFTNEFDYVADVGFNGVECLHFCGGESKLFDERHWNDSNLLVYETQNNRISFTKVNCNDLINMQTQSECSVILIGQHFWYVGETCKTSDTDPSQWNINVNSIQSLLKWVCLQWQKNVFHRTLVHSVILNCLKCIAHKTPFSLMHSRLVPSRGRNRMRISNQFDS